MLKRIFSDGELVRSLSPEAYYTALIFWRDFEKSAINLPEESRKKFVELSQEILTLGRQFLNEGAVARPPAYIQYSELEGLKVRLLLIRLHRHAKPGGHGAPGSVRGVGGSDLWFIRR